jgi:peptide deformylase
MKPLPILEYPAAILGQPSSKVPTITPDIKKLIDDMVFTMRSFKGGAIGLAAPQVGESVRITVIEYTPEKNEHAEQAIPLMILVNPKIISRSSEEETGDEGCLSLPGIEIPIKRARKIKVRAQNETGETIQFRASDLLARIIQHEVDHLDGKLIIDYVKNKEHFIHKLAAAKQL